MLGYMFLTITLFTIGELALLIYVGGLIGFWSTLGLVLLTAFVGASLVRNEGTRALIKIQKELSMGRVPASAMLDGIAIMLGGAFLMTPGFITDGIALIMLFPLSRAIIKAFFIRRCRSWIERQQVHVSHIHVAPNFDPQPTVEDAHWGQPQSPYDDGNVIDITPESSDDSTP